jgi:poly(A) polymerase
MDENGQVAMTETSHEPTVLERDQHNISRKNIDPDAVRVLYRLHHAGFTAYLVGGGVRDLLLGRTPKDFDVGTNAHPNQIRGLFRNCFLIGRRFRLAHIKFGSKVIETSTFRRTPDPAAGADTEEPGALLHHRDNTFGSPEEDARRRDFTINGLFYDIGSFQVIDYVGGLADLKAGLVRSIGNPEIRFREDPVRMIRAVRFASRLGFTIEPATWNAIRTHHAEIALASPARMLEEIYRLFPYRSSQPAVRLLHESRLLSDVLPDLSAYLERPGVEREPLWANLAALDEGSSLVPQPDPSLFLAALYHAPFVEAARRHALRPNFGNWHVLAHDLLRPTIQRYHLPKRTAFETLWMLACQAHFAALDEPRQGGRPQHADRVPARLARQPLFPAALALYSFHLAADGIPPDRLSPWMAALQDAGDSPAHAHPSHGRRLPHEHADGDRRFGRRRRRGRRRGGAPDNIHARPHGRYDDAPHPHHVFGVVPAAPSP